ncbi:aminotransferase class IV [Anabaena sp. CCY 9910]|uniref:aminotransferase class IV n=1 Tax=Anabaena sp. CCY 9910 TaxID=3103870 RepID=UPI0039E18AA5
MFWYNGKLINSQTLELDIYDPGLLYGATIFTTLRVYGHSLDHTLTNWQAHCDRLHTSIQSFAWEQPDWNRIRQGAEILLTHFPVLRITIFPDGREWIIGRYLPQNLLEIQKYGVSCTIAETEIYRSLPSHKTGNYLSAWMAKTYAAKLNSQEAILVNTAGNWLETTTGNLWGWQNGSWWTPPLTEGILPGIGRQQLIHWLQTHQQTVQEEPWTSELVNGFEAIAYTNSVVEVIPIHTVYQPTESLQYDPYHPRLQKLRELFLA